MSIVFDCSTALASVLDIDFSGRLVGAAAFLQVPVTSVRDVCYYHWELFRCIRAVVFPLSGKCLH